MDKEWCNAQQRLYNIEEDGTWEFDSGFGGWSSCCVWRVRIYLAMANSAFCEEFSAWRFACDIQSRFFESRVSSFSWSWGCEWSQSHWVSGNFLSSFGKFGVEQWLCRTNSYIAFPYIGAIEKRAIKATVPVWSLSSHFTRHHHHHQLTKNNLWSVEKKTVSSTNHHNIILSADTRCRTTT